MPYFLEITKCIADMMKGNQTFKWSDVGKKVFKETKTTISKACILLHPDYTKEFIIYYNALAHMLFSILMQEKKRGNTRTYFLHEFSS